MFSVTSPNTRREDEMEQEKLRGLRGLNDAREQGNFQQKQSDFARTFGRELTGGAASTRGRAGRQVPVSSGAIPKQETYYNSEAGQNRIKAQGSMARAAQEYLDASDEKAKAKAKQALLKSYNDSPMSSVTDASDIKFTDAGMKFKRADGGFINLKPVSLDDFRRIGEANNLFDKSVFQRDAGGIPGAAAAPPQQQQSSTKADAAKKAAADRVKIELNKYNEYIKFDSGKSADEVKHQHSAYLDAVKKAEAHYTAAGMPQGQTQMNPEDDVKSMIDKGMMDSEIKEVMWKKYGSRDVMAGVEKDINDRAIGGMPIEAKATPGASADVPVGKDMAGLPTSMPPAPKKQGTKAKVKADPVPGIPADLQKVDKEIAADKIQKLSDEKKSQNANAIRQMRINFRTKKTSPADQIKEISDLYAKLGDKDSRMKKELQKLYRMVKDRAE